MLPWGGTYFHSSVCFSTNTYRLTLVCHALLSYSSSVQSLSGVRLFETPWTAARQASLLSWSLFKLMSIEWATNLDCFMPPTHIA